MQEMWGIFKPFRRLQGENPLRPLNILGGFDRKPRSAAQTLLEQG